MCTTDINVQLLGICLWAYYMLTPIILYQYLLYSFLLSLVDKFWSQVCILLTVVYWRGLSTDLD
jgi:hypothetical protein